MKNVVELIGVPTDLGANITGASSAPHMLRAHGLVHALEEIGCAVVDKGNIVVPERKAISDKSVKHIDEIVAYNRELKTMVMNALNQGHFPLIVGGDHSLAMGSINGAAAHCAKEGKKLHVIWIDAHADFNTPQSSPSGNIHGMPLAAVLGEGHELLLSLNEGKLHASNITLIGLRDIDVLEKQRVLQSDMHYFTMHEIDRYGMAAIMDKTLNALDDNSRLHISLDIDGLDPSLAPGVSTPVRGGLSFREARLLFEMAHASGKLGSIDVAEFNPNKDIDKQTAQVCLELIQSAFGKTIL